MKTRTEQLTGKLVDVTPLFQMAQIPTDKIEIIETRGMYPYKKKIEDNWAYYTAIGMKRFKEVLNAEEKTINDIGVVGICSGLSVNQLKKLDIPWIWSTPISLIFLPLEKRT